MSSAEHEKENDTVQPTRATQFSTGSNGRWGIGSRTAATWLAGTKSDSDKTTKERVLHYWVKAGNYKDLEEAVALFKSEKLDPAGEGTKLVNFLEKAGKASSTISIWRNVLGGLFRYLAPDMPRDLYKHAKKIDVTPLVEEKIGLDRDEIKLVLQKANPKYRAAISVLLSTGCRIGELVSIRVRKLNFSKSPARVGFLAPDTKTNKARQSLLSSETVDFIQEWVKSREYQESEFLFPSPDNPTRRQTVDTTRTGIYEVFASAGLLKKEGKMHVLHPHSFRSINLAFTKATGFPEDWAETLVGHKRGVESDYEIPEERAKLWVEKVEPKFCFLGRASASEVKSLEQAIDARAKEAEELKDKVETEVSKLRKQLEASRKPTQNVPTSSPETKKFENHDWIYVKTTFGSEAYDSALAEGYEEFKTGENGLVYLRKPKASGN